MDGKRYCLILGIVVSSLNREPFMSPFIIGWVYSMSLGFVLIIYNFLHRLVNLPITMDPLLMPLVSWSCLNFHIDSMMPKCLHIHHTLVRRNSLA